MAALNGTANNYPPGQCTQYADERYHQLTGFYVPWSGNAADWSFMAGANGWSVSSKPVVPSIIVLQGGVQGADIAYGHVAVVESVSGSNIQTSNLNWGPNYSQVSSVTFHAGPGVSFVYATANGAIQGSTGGVFSSLSDTVSKATSKLGPSSDVAQTLIAIDDVLALLNPFDGLSTLNPLAWLEGLGNNLFEDMAAITYRLVLISIGVVIVMKVLSDFVDFGSLYSTAASFMG